MKGNRIAVIVALVVVAVIVGVFALRGGKFPPGSTEGTIGAANRYTAQQITNADVVLKDANVQAFLQSDTFHQLATNADFRNAVENKNFVELLRNQTAFNKVTVASEELRSKGRGISNLAAATMADGAIEKLPASQVEALFSVENARLMEDARFVEFINSPAFIEAAKQGLPEALKVEGAKPFATGLTELARQFPDGLQMLSSEAARHVTRDKNFASAFEALSQMPDNGVAKALANHDALAIMADPAFGRIENLTAFQEALKGNQTQLAALFASNVDWGKLTTQAE